MQVREIRQQPIYIPFKKDKSLMSQQTPVNSTAQGSINNRINFKGDRYTLNINRINPTRAIYLKHKDL